MPELILYEYKKKEQVINDISDKEKKKLIDAVSTSTSSNLVKKISETMEGSTMHHHYHILYDIRTLLGPEKKIYTEIGTYNGGSACLMLQHFFETDIYCIDPLHLDGRNSLQIVENNIKKFNKNNYKNKIYQKFSTDKTLITELDKLNFKTDILFIDGDHSYDGVKFDFENYEKYVNLGGYIIFDDYNDYKDSPDVKKYVDELVPTLDKSKYIIIGYLDNIQNAYDGLNLKISNEFVIKKIY
jgi:predicted O-methyltransferase YrrM